MSVERRKNSKFWYGRLSVGGRERVVSLRIEVKGVPPLPGQVHGDTKFEKSRREAEAALERMKHELRTSSDADLLKKAYELKTRDQIPRIGTRFLYLHFRRALGPRGRRRSKRYLGQIASRLRAFHEFLERRFPRAETLLDVSEKVADEFVDELDRKYAKSATYNNWLKDIRSAIGRILKHMSMENRNPFRRAQTREVDDNKSREPFTPEELETILRVAKETADQDTCDLIVIAACTAMRRTDCCSLTWDVIDLAKNSIATTAAKTKKPLLIPILPLLESTLARLDAARDKSRKRVGTDFVLPTMARLVRRNPDAITDRMREILLAAGFSNDQLQVPKSVGAHRAVCVRGFSSLRTTFTTLALNAGIPIELVRKVTGHTTDNIVRTRYHNPSRDDLLAKFRERMPAAFGTANAAGEKISGGLRVWLCGQFDRIIAGGNIPAIVDEMKTRLARAGLA